MRAQKALIPVLFAISAAILTQAGVVPIMASNTESTTVYPPATEVEVITPDSTYVEPEPVESSLSDDVNLPQASSANQPQTAIVGDQYANKQWTLDRIDVSRLWQTAAVKPDALVAVLDTGIDSNHEDLDGLIMAETDFTDTSGPVDNYGHGTHIAGIIAAEDDGAGIVGVAPGCSLLNVKVADDLGRCRASILAEGIIWAVDNGARVINISIEMNEPSPQLEEAVNYAWNHGAVIVAAAGNSGSQSPVYPAYYENCLAVAAIKQDGSLAPLSNYGDWVDVAAPGFDIYSTLPDNGYGYKTGTSFAAAYVSGMAALLFNVLTDANGDGELNDEVRIAIESGYQQSDIIGASEEQIDNGQVTF